MAEELEGVLPVSLWKAMAEGREVTGVCVVCGVRGGGHLKTGTQNGKVTKTLTLSALQILLQEGH